MGWTSLALAAEKGALLGSLLGCFSGLVSIFQKFREEATQSQQQQPGPAAPLKRLRPSGSSLEGPVTPKGAVNREPSLRLLGGQASAQRPKWQFVRQELPDTAFLLLFSRLAYEAKCGHLHSEGNKPAQECKAATLVEDELACFDGHPLQIQSFEFSTGRTHLKVTYPGTGTGTIAFVCNFDLPRCNPNAATTRCLPCSVPESGLYPGGVGHTALLVLLLRELGRSQPRLTWSIVCIFLAAHCHGEGGCADLLEKGHLNELKGPVYWLDGAASALKEHEWSEGAPCLCTGALGSLSWMLRVPSNAAQEAPSVELAAQAVASMKASFTRDFTADAPQVPGANASAGTYLRCTRMETQKSAQHPNTCVTYVYGLIRLMPYDTVRISDVVEKVQDEYVKEVNDRLVRKQPGPPPTLGRAVTNEEDDGTVATRRKRRSLQLSAQAAELELTWAQRLQGKERRLSSWSKALSSPHTPKRRGMPGAEELALDFEGISTKSDSLGRRALEEALWESSTKKSAITPVFRHFMVHGSVPHARRVQLAGGDVQLLGFLQPKAGENEELNEDSCSMEGMRYGYKVLLRIIKVLEQHTDRREDLEVDSVEQRSQQAEESAEPVNAVEIPKEEILESIPLPEMDSPEVNGRSENTLQTDEHSDEVPADTAWEVPSHETPKAEKAVEEGMVEPAQVISPLPPETTPVVGEGKLPQTASSPVPTGRCFSDSLEPPEQADEAADEEPKMEWPKMEGLEGIQEAGAETTSSSTALETMRSPSLATKDARPIPGERVKEAVKQFERMPVLSSPSSAVPKVAAKKAASKKAAAKSEAAAKKAAAKKPLAPRTSPKIRL